MGWEDHRAAPVLCRIQIRQTYAGRPMRSGAEQLNGREVQLVAAWLMDEQDAYPGEWALMPESGSIDGLVWIASGDVVPGQKKGGDK